MSWRTRLRGGGWHRGMERNAHTAHEQLRLRGIEVEANLRLGGPRRGVGAGELLKSLLRQTDLEHFWRRRWPVVLALIIGWSRRWALAQIDAVDRVGTKRHAEVQPVGFELFRALAPRPSSPASRGCRCNALVVSRCCGRLRRRVSQVLLMNARTETGFEGGFRSSRRRLRSRVQIWLVSVAVGSLESTLR